MNDLVLVKKDDLQELLGRTVRQAIAEAMTETRAASPTLSIDEATVYLNDKGVKISKSTLYKHTSEGTIPFRRFGERKLIFDRSELEQWVQDRIK